MDRIFLLLLFLLSTPVFSNECDAVATVFNKTICMSDIEIKAKNNLHIDYVIKQQKRILAYKIREIGIVNLLDKEAYTPKQHEVESYLSYKKEFDAEKLKWNKIIANTIRELLTKYEYNKENRLKLETGLKVAEYNLQPHIKMDITPTVLRNAEDEEKRINLQEIQIEIKQWKINKALFKKYGGRVIFQQFGIEPIGANQALIEEIKNKGRLKILNPKFKDFLTEEEAYNKSDKHNFLSKPEELFSKPYWEMGSNEEQYISDIKYYKSIPHK